MTSADNKFFEAYKQLEQKCNEIYSAKSGVSEYIADMERQRDFARNLPDFERDYKNLKHLRWIRNQIAHGAGGGTVCKKEDYEALKDFYARLLKGNDPLARIKMSKRAAKGGRRNGTGNAIFFLIFAAVIFAFILIAVVLVSR